MLLTPQPRVHAAHGGSHDQARVFDAETFGQQAVLRLHHVVVAIARKFRMQAVARLAGLPMPQRIRQHDEITRGIQRLPGAEQLAGKLRADETAARAAGAVDDQHGVVFSRRAVGVIVDAHLGQGLTRCELEVVDDEVTFAHRRAFRGQRPRDWPTPSGPNIAVRA